MLALLLGADDFSKKEYVNSLVKDKGADLVMFWEGDELPAASRLTETDLFSKPKVFIFQGAMPALPEDLSALANSPNQIIFSLKSLDKRKKENKDLLANSHITTKEFNLPHGKELNKWIEDRVKLAGGLISSAAVEALAVALGRDDAKETKFGGKVTSVEEIYTLWQADSEIKKLLAYSASREINEADVKQVANPNGEVDVFDLTNAIAESQKQKAVELLHKFLLPQAGADEKGAIIQLNALLSEQFRNVAMVQDFVAHKTSDDKILESTGWKSGRLFVIKKIASKFPAKKVLEFLNKLAALDEEVKTSSTPPKVLLDLIVAQLL